MGGVGRTAVLLVLPRAGGEREGGGVSISGIDVSSYQGTVNWPAVAGAGYQFAAVKATEGVGYVNPFFAVQWAGAKQAGMVRIAYHFAQPSQSAAADEAAFFLSTVGRLEPGDGLALDLESGGGNLLSWALTFLRAVEAAVGFKPFFYSGLWFMQPAGLVGSPDLAQYGLWLAAYQANAPAPPAPWQFWAIWQTGQGSVPGVGGVCDLDVFNGTADQLRAYGMQVSPMDPCAALRQQLSDTQAQLTAEQTRNAALVAAMQSSVATLQGALS